MGGVLMLKGGTRPQLIYAAANSAFTEFCMICGACLIGVAVEHASTYLAYLLEICTRTMMFHGDAILCMCMVGESLSKVKCQTVPYTLVIKGTVW